MDKTGHIEIRVVGSKGNMELSPENYDIREIMSILENAESLFFLLIIKIAPLLAIRLRRVL